jgi:hypothetical protein
MLGRFRLRLRAGLRGFVGPAYGEGGISHGNNACGSQGTYSEVNTRADNDAFLATIAVVVDGDDVTRLQISKSIVNT